MKIALQMEIATKYDPSQVEDKWYKYWMDNKIFRSVPDEREPYCIVIPPPNVTGVLHMGHMLNNTIQDIFVRRAHMLGKNALWLPGTDHASIATEARVVAKLKSEGITKKDISREKFLEHAWEWTHKHGGIILEQLKKLGASCDWDRTRFTMDEMLSESVLLVFIDLFEKGLIYRGIRMVNWDPKALTAVSDEEVNYKEVNSKLYHVRYLIEGTKDEWITIATTRPETILGDTAICVHPDDERYASFKDKRALVPLINRSIPIIYDEYVEKDFGTGALKVTPAHDINDYNLGIKHKLPGIDIFNDNGTLNENAEILIGEDRFQARTSILKLLAEQGFLTKTEDIINKVGYSERTDEVIEPKLSIQWFMKMTEMAKPALDMVMNDTVKFHPAKFKNTYKYWMENVKDWCISRQLWWGHRIPAFYLPNGEIVAALNTDDAIKKAKEKWGDKYDYSLVNYINTDKKVKILYNGLEYEQTPRQHLKCQVEKTQYKLGKTTEQFINQANLIHDFKYNYDDTIYVKANSKLLITCISHGDFNQRAQDHLNGVGCPICNDSKGEKEISKILKKSNIKFERQKVFNDCRNILPLPFDFYIESLRVCIEFDGIQHSKSIKFFGGHEKFDRTITNDKIKSDYCEDNYIDLIRIRYDQVNEIEKILTDNLMNKIKILRRK